MVVVVEQAMRAKPTAAAAAEAMGVFAPLANRLGVWSIKADLEDLAFMVSARLSLSYDWEGTALLCIRHIQWACKLCMLVVL